MLLFVVSARSSVYLYGSVYSVLPMVSNNESTTVPTLRS